MDFLNQEAVRDLRKRLQPMLEAFAKENGLRLSLSSSTFTPYNVSFKLELALVSQSGEALTREAEKFFHRAGFYGLSPADLGRTVVYGDKTLKIVGLNPRSRTAPILMEDSLGNRYKISASMVKAILAHKCDATGKPTAPMQQALPLESD